MDHIHFENMWIRILARQLVPTLEAEEAVPVLLEALDGEAARTRKYAAYFLGFYEAAEHADRLSPLLHEKDGSGAAIRTLGKWHVQDAVPEIIPFLRDPKKETRRVLAANALREIGDPQAVPFLIEALADPYFTVRKSVARALVSFGLDGEKELCEALYVSIRYTAERNNIHFGRSAFPSSDQAVTKAFMA